MQVTLEQHGFELCGFTYAQIWFSINPHSITWSVVGSIWDCKTVNTEGSLRELSIYGFWYRQWHLELIPCSYWETTVFINVIDTILNVLLISFNSHLKFLRTLWRKDKYFHLLSTGEKVRFYIFSSICLSLSITAQ